jgi:hypothetical protein
VKEYFVAMAQVAIGNHDAALELLEKGGTRSLVGLGGD